MAPETGMLLLHQHGDCCMLVSDPLTCGSLRSLFPATHSCHAEVILLITAQILA